MPFFNKFGSGSARKFGLSKGFNLSPPTSLSAIPAETSVSISFTAPLGDTPTNIAYALSTNGGSTFGAFTDLSPADFTSPITISGLTSNQAYVVKLRSTIDTNQSEDSAPLSFQTLAAAPTGLSASGATASAITISFTQATGGGATISNYKYALSTNGGASYGAYTALSPADSTSPITITGLAASQSYFVKIRAVTSAGDGTESSATSFTTLTAFPTSVEYIAVGAGAGGRPDTAGSGGVVGGGGGGGGMASGSFNIATSTTYTCTVGAGGAGSFPATSGTNTTITGSGLSTITGGGGQAGTGYPAVPGAGGSASGGTTNQTGGAGGNGGAFRAPSGGSGNASSITGSSVTYGGGGGGARGGFGGAGGGGQGGQGSNGFSGTNNLGGGGGGAEEYNDIYWQGGAGGHGVVIIRHSNTLRQASTFTGTSVVNTGGYLIYTFNATGTIAWA